MKVQRLVTDAHIRLTRFYRSSMNSRIKTRHLGLLTDIIRQGGSVPADQIDGRMLRPLKADLLVTVRNGIVSATPAGRNTVLSVAAPAVVHSTLSTANPIALSGKQAEVLRLLCRTGEPTLADTIDGRVLRALKLRGFAGEAGGWVSATEAGREYFDKHVRRRRRGQGDSVGSVKNARAEVIIRYIEALEAAVPTGAEVMVGDVAAYVDDIFAGLRRFARGLDGEVGRRSA